MGVHPTALNDPMYDPITLKSFDCDINKNLVTKQSTECMMEDIGDEMDKPCPAAVAHTVNQAYTQCLIQSL